MTRLSVTLLLAIFAAAPTIPSLSAGVILGETLSCTHYAQANTQSATCGGRPTVVCSQSCIGGVVVDGCSPAQQTSGPLTRQTCTIGFSQTSATNSLCVNGQGSFSCTGVPVGLATCKGCVDSQLQSAILQTAVDIGSPGSSASTVIPVNAAGPSPAAPIVSQNITLNATAPQTPPAPVTLATAVAPAAALSTQVVTIISQSAKSDNATSAATTTPGSQIQYLDPYDNTTATASIIYIRNSAQLAVTLGLMTAGVINL